MKWSREIAISVPSSKCGCGDCHFLLTPYLLTHILNELEHHVDSAPDEERLTGCLGGASEDMSDDYMMMMMMMMPVILNLLWLLPRPVTA